MNKQWLRCMAQMGVALVFCAALSLMRVQADATMYLTDKDHDHLAGLRAAALQGDHSKVHDLIAALSVGHASYIATALHGLVHLHATEALPDIEAFLQKEQTGFLADEARATRARLLADSALGVPNAPKVERETAASKEGPAPVEPARLQATRAQVQRFQQELNLDEDKLTAGAAEYLRKRQQGDKAWPLEVAAISELADMAYHGDYAAFASLPEFKNPEIFKVDTNIMLRMKYAAVPRALRAQQMVDDLAKSGGNGTLLQLAIDEGLPASHAAAKKLMEMDKHREQYAHTLNGETYVHPGFASLFRLIAGVGDKEQLPLIEHFMKDKDGYIVYYATQVRGQVMKGMRRIWASG